MSAVLCLDSSSYNLWRLRMYTRFAKIRCHSYCFKEKSMRQPMIAGNWKMHGNCESIALLLEALSKQALAVSETVELAVFPPFVFLPMVARALAESAIRWGGQTVSDQSEDGAYTGEVSAGMLKSVGCEYVLIGHSERRHLYHESNDLLARKTLAAVKACLRPIYCVGETIDQRKAGETLEIITKQLAQFIPLIDNSTATAPAVIAYEPVWAIGTGEVASPDQAEQVHAAIREMLAKSSADLAESVRILYGGSVKPENASRLFAMPNIDGALVGGASLNANQFIEIAKQWNN